MRIIDAHTHIFDVLAGFGPRGELRAVGGGKARWANGDVMAIIPEGMGENGFTADTLAGLLKTNGVDKAILLQGSLYGFQNEAVLAAARAYPGLFVPSGTFDPFCGNAEELADLLINKEKIGILKFEISSGAGLMSYHRPFPLDGEVFADTFAMMEKAGATLVIDIGAYGMSSYQPEELSRVAKRHPGLRIVVCHLMAPGLNDAVHLERSLKYLALPNVWFDLAAIPWNVYPETYPYRTGLKYVSMATDIVGSSKLIWGTDVPCVLTRESYPNLIKYIAEGGIFTKSELDGVFYKNAVEAYELE